MTSGAGWLALALSLGLPAGAAASVTPSIDLAAKTATLTSDDAADAVSLVPAGANISFRVGTTTSADWDPATPGDQAPADDGTWRITIRGNGGDDILAAAANVLGATLEGGAGNDVVGGSARADVLDGGGGDDRLTGAVGDDTVRGDAGDDTMVWNNGDNTDTNDGGAGRDTTEVNGALTAGDQFTFGPGTGAGTVRFARTNLVPFAIDISTTEVLDMNTFGGDDAITGAPGVAGRILPRLDGGVGRDQLTGSDAADLLEGGADVDTLSGADGDDRLAGDRGDDVMAGGEGSDTLVWNDGDNTDRMDGDGGLDVVEVNASVTQGDVLTVRPEGARSRFDRTNLVPFALDISAEVLDVRGFAGDDQLSVADATTLSIHASGGSGNDTLAGAGAEDVLDGGTGNDTLTGNGGRDALSGADGDDVLNTRDGVVDVARGGAGSDRATADREDGADGIEALDVPALPQPPVPGVGDRATLPASTVAVRNGRVGLRVACPAGLAAACTGRLELVTAGAVRVGGLRAVVRLGSVSFTVPAGQTRTVSVRLATGARRIGRRVRVQAVARTVAGAGVLGAQRTFSLTLR